MFAEFSVTAQPPEDAAQSISTERVELNAANSPEPTAPLRAYAERPRSAEPGLRVLPLDSFHWGGAPRSGLLRAPRVRGDHCLIRVTTGSFRLILPGGSAEHGPGSVLFIPLGTAFATLPSVDSSGQVLLIPSSLADRLTSPLPSRLLVGADISNALLSDLTALYVQEHLPSAPNRVELISAQLHQLASAPKHPSRAAPAQSLLASFVELAGRELGRGRTVADLAAALGSTAAQLESACRQQRGCSALQVMYDLRLDRARKLLSDPARCLVSIAEELGFTGAAHLNRAFMAATGRSAEAFRPR